MGEISKEDDGRIKLIALDLDGTLLTNSKTISQMNKEIVQKIAEYEKEGGTMVCIASGRMTPCISPYVRELGIDCHIIGYNGAQIVGPTRNGRPILYSNNLSRIVADRVINHCVKKNLTLNVYLGEDLHGCNSTKHAYLNEVYERMTSATYIYNDSYSHLLGEEPIKLLVLCPPKEVKGLYAEFRSLVSENDCHMIYGDFFIEFLSPSVNKGSGLKKISEILGIHLDSIAAFGDGENDFEFLQTAGLGICMSNGVERTKKVAARVSQFSNMQDGVAKELQIMIDQNIIAHRS
eukprot:Nk52_evm13s262 gene=Nk52_evmTU13s262